MTPDQTAQDLRNRDQAEQDLNDIRALQNQPGWRRWYLRRMHQKRDAAKEQALTAITPEAREQKRQEWMLLVEILKMADDDAASCERALTSPQTNAS